MGAKAAANKTGRHRRILTKKKLKNDKNRARNEKKKKNQTSRLDSRGRSGGSEADAMEDVKPTRKRSPSKPVAKGQGSGTPGARAASLQVPKAVRVSTRGGRRRKATWRSMGKG